MKIVIENADQNDFNELAQLARIGRIHTFYMTDEDEGSQGEWIDYSDEGYVECPFCGSATNCEDNKDELHYCWNCGAKMKQG